MISGLPTPKVTEVMCGGFKFTYLGYDSMLIEKVERGQQLTLEPGETFFLANELQEIQKIFRPEYCKKERCFDCDRWQPSNRESCPLKGKTGSDFYCKSFVPKKPNDKVKKHGAVKEQDGEQE